jgi:G:T-mismatch repair DNA endonuclease (very short patch repair protein)
LSRRVVERPYNIPDETRKKGADRLRVQNFARKVAEQYGHSDATRAKLSEATARAHAEGKIGRPSKLEDVVAEQLDRLGVEHVRQFAFRDSLGRFAFVVDFWIPSHGCAIEVNGTYWHVDPRVYPGAINATQRRCLEKYCRKLDELTQMGIRVGEAWEIDLERDPAEAVLVAYRDAIGG